SGGSDDASDAPGDDDAGVDGDDTDGDGTGEAGAGSKEGGGDAAALEPMNGQISVLSSDTVLDYTISLPAGFDVSEFSSDINQTWTDPDAEFGERDTRVSIIATPVATDASGLVESFQEINGTITVLDQADEDAFSWFTYATPSVSDVDSIAFGSAQSARTIAGDISLQCTAGTQHSIDEEWSDADAATVADQMLAICRSLAAG
ncbi:MAG: hypothetical protein AAFP84_14845, partial [Actinomycetota bacterium]